MERGTRGRGFGSLLRVWTAHGEVVAPLPAALRMAPLSGVLRVVTLPGQLLATVLVVLLLGACGGAENADAGAPEEGLSTEAQLQGVIEVSGAEVGLVYWPVGGGESQGGAGPGEGADSGDRGAGLSQFAIPSPIEINPDLRMHAASTMKVPVMIQVFLDREAGMLTLDDPVPVDPTFNSIVDGSEYELSVDSDSEGELYGRIGREATVRELIELMITVSSNFATNLLIEEVDAERVTATMRDLGADSIQVLRGVEDIKAFEAGLSNTTTARDLAVIMAALAREEVGSPQSAREMLEILKRQQFREKIPAGLPEGTVVAHKTGNITRISHDAAIVYPPDGDPYVLVILIRGLEDEPAAELAAELSRIVWQGHVAEG